MNEEGSQALQRTTLAALGGVLGAGEHDVASRRATCSELFGADWLEFGPDAAGDRS